MKKEEKLLRAIGGVDDDLIADAMEPQKRNKQPAWLRWTAVAACLCLVLALPVGATVLGRLGEIIESEKFTSYHTTSRIDLSSLSAEALDAAAAQKTDVGIYPMDSISDAEEFLGLELPENDVLSGSGPKNFDIITQEGEEYRAPCFVHLFNSDEHGLTCVDTELYYKIGNVYAFVWYRAATEKMPFESGGGVGLDTDKTNREEYVTPSGLDCVLYMKHAGGDFLGWRGQACTAVDDYLVYIDISAQSQYEVVDGLKTILDAYG